nr:MAG TPA: restriction alleviation protein [Caudoviricetes sp.]
MTKEMTEVRLKPCPFCGSEDFVLGFHEGHNEMRVKCKRCKTLFTIFDTLEKFILTLIWMRENINFYRDLYKVEKEENDRLLKENQKQGRTINQNWDITNKRCNKSLTKKENGNISKSFI